MAEAIRAPGPHAGLVKWLRRMLEPFPVPRSQGSGAQGSKAQDRPPARRSLAPPSLWLAVPPDLTAPPRLGPPASPRAGVGRSLGLFRGAAGPRGQLVGFHRQNRRCRFVRYPVRSERLTCRQWRPEVERHRRFAVTRVQCEEPAPLRTRPAWAAQPPETGSKPPIGARLECQAGLVPRGCQRRDPRRTAWWRAPRFGRRQPLERRLKEPAARRPRGESR